MEKTCRKCGNSFKAISAHQWFCPDCKIQIREERLKQKREKMREKRAKEALKEKPEKPLTEEEQLKIIQKHLTEEKKEKKKLFTELDTRPTSSITLYGVCCPRCRVRPCICRDD